MKYLFPALLPLLIWSCHLSAQPNVPSPTSSVPQSELPASADRIAAAVPVVDKLWPNGTYREVTIRAMTKMLELFNNSISEAENAGAETAKGRMTGSSAVTKDPHIRQRLEIMSRVIIEELGPVIDQTDADARDALKMIYARKFSVQQLNELNQFLTTPTGRAYGQRWVDSFYDPEMLNALQKRTPAMSKAMPAIMDKVTAATAHLPAPQPSAAKANNLAETENTSRLDEASKLDPAIMWSEADKKAVAKQEANVAGAESHLADQRGRLELMKFEARSRAGEKLSAEDQDYLASLRETYGKVK